MLPSTFSEIAAQERAQDLHEAARRSAAYSERPRRRTLRALRHEPVASAPARDLDPASADGTLTIRLAGPGDAPALAELSALDGARRPRGDVLVAEAGGIVRAALPLAGGRPLADPFYPARPLVALLEARAAQLAAAAASQDAGGGPLFGRPRFIRTG